MDPAEHLLELAASYGLSGRGVGMLTAASVDRTMVRSDGGVTVSATVGLRVPTWAAVPEGTVDAELAPIVLPPDPPSGETPGTETPGTNAPGADAPGMETPDAGVPVPDVDAPVPGVLAAGSGAVVERRPGTVNIVVHVPVALSDAALVNAVMTATEAKTQALLEAGYPCTGTASDAICVAAPIPRAGEEEPFAGPRSAWGGRLARAVYAAVHAGALDYTGHLKRNRAPETKR
jgi:adenosylcobinamide amidohydrolase